MKGFKLLALAVFLVSGYSTSAQAALVDIALSPSACDTTISNTCWTTDVNSKLSLAEIEAITGASGLQSLYKQDVGASSDSGIFAASYETSFANSSTDPQDALITLIAGKDSIDCGTCYLLVKDGNHSPAQYIFNLSLAGMINSISATDFWPAGGAISHVEIVGNLSPVPVPAAAWLFGTALIGFIGLSRRTGV
ncbi:MAG: VPLPA-CTERM sorting domain-containing protein [Gammaproteobacteria bacterium]|jgi:hypothetical protein|nr:VPLPA-CTERM sorting domain-containing protein [Gammaproteobacteria bacterium]